MQEAIDKLRADMQLHQYQIESLKAADEKLLEVLATLNSQLSAVDKHLAIIATKLDPMVEVQGKVSTLLERVAVVEQKTEVAGNTATEARGLAWKAYLAIAAASAATSAGVHQVVSFLWS